MKEHAFGPTGSYVSAIGQGTWKLEFSPRGEAIAALRAGIDLGMTHIDTAEMYGMGAAETIIAEAIQGRRAEVFLVSKVHPDNASRNGVLAACEASLRRLGTDHLNCYLLHWPSSYPLEETLGAFDELVRAGKIRSWGVSNFDVKGLEEVVKIAGPGRLACNQVLYHLDQRDIEHDVLPWCEAHQVAVVGYTPFGKGTFPPRGQEGQVLESIAKKYDVSARNVALAFLTRRPSLFAIPKASNVAHTRDNARAGQLTLTAEDIDAIDRAFPRGPVSL